MIKFKTVQVSKENAQLFEKIAHDCNTAVKPSADRKGCYDIFYSDETDLNFFTVKYNDALVKSSLPVLQSAKPFVFTLPNHFKDAVDKALNDLARNGRPIAVTKFRINEKINGFYQLEFNGEATQRELFQLGVKVGYYLAFVD